MVHFIIPVRSRRVAKDWNNVRDLCAGTLRSVYNQTSQKHSVQLVCHEPPVEEVGDRVNVESVRFGVPSNKREMMVDKKKKVRIGAAQASKEPGDYVMILDADDRVDRRLVEYVHRQEDADVWVIHKGYVWPYGRRFCFKWDNFHGLCGSSHLIRYDGGNMPTGREDEEDYTLMTPHGKIKKKAERRGLRVESIPFEAGCYVTDVGENHSGISMVGYMHKGRFLKKVMGFRFLTSSIRESFAISDGPYSES
jgi:hypothetical protein